jgi:predicted lipoprotein with Yx(FWY)xxD motif
MSILLSILAAAAQPPAVPVEVQTIKEGDVFVLRSLDGAKPLYTFDKDEPGKSNCADRCLAAWPALPAKAGSKPTGKWTVIARPEGASQWAYEGKPVYTFVRDTAGTATGDGMGGVWHLLPTAPAK